MKDQNSQNSTNQSPRQSKLQSKQQLAQDYARNWFHKVWDVRGGGLYAVGYILTFLYFEIRSVGADIVDFFGTDLLSSELFGFLIGIVVDSFTNMVKALMWPVYIIQINPMYGGIALGLAFYIFPKYLKKPLEKKLFGEEREKSS